VIKRHGQERQADLDSGDGAGKAGTESEGGGVSLKSLSIFDTYGAQRAGPMKDNNLIQKFVTLYDTIFKESEVKQRKEGPK